MLIRKEKGKDGDPRSLFMTDLIKEIQEIEKDPNNYVILMWDANESIHDKSGNLCNLIFKTRLVDALIAEDPEPLPTYIRGKKQIDFILSSQA
jgi:hypothetical protein